MEPVDIYKRDGKVILPYSFVVIIATLFPLGDSVLKEAGNQETKLMGEGEEDDQTPPPDL